MDKIGHFSSAKRLFYRRFRAILAYRRAAAASLWVQVRLSLSIKGSFPGDMGLLCLPGGGGGIFVGEGRARCRLVRIGLADAAC